MSPTFLRFMIGIAEESDLFVNGAASSRAVNRKQRTYAALKRRSSTVLRSCYIVLKRRSSTVFSQVAIPSTTSAVLALLATLLLSPIAYGQSRAVLQAESKRQAAPELNLKDSEGKTAKLNEYHGKILVVDFWATWCHGCKTEIPWFAEFQRKYGADGLNVIGISMDDDGWKVVKPFIQSRNVPYRIVLGNDSVAKQYAIGNMPDTFLIDREGRIAAAYAGVVDREDIEKNIRALLDKQ